MRARPAASIACLLLLLIPVVSRAQDRSLQDLDRLQRLRESVKVDADSLEYSEAEAKVIARGNVHIVMENRSLFADEVTVDLDDQVMMATGNVLLMEGLNRLQGDRLEYNYRTNLGVITNASAFLEPGVSFSGVEIRREGERQYHILDSKFTTCRLCQPEPQTPDWEFRASEATVYQDDFIVSRNSSFWIKGIPALFAPVAAYPIGPRRTGFLIPRFLYSNSDGFVVKQPFFWAISPSMDLTLTPIYRTKVGFEIDADFRYILAEDAHGEMTGQYVHDISSDAPQTNRGEVKWLHDQVLAPTWTFKADVTYVSDQTFQQTFVETPVIVRTQRTIPSNIYVTQATPQYMLLGLVNVTRDLSQTTETRTGRLPEVGFQWLPNTVGGTPLLVGGQTSAVYLTQNTGDDTARFDFYPGLGLPLTLTPWLTATSGVAFRETVYSEKAGGSGATNRTLVELGERLTSRFARRFDEPGFGLLRLTHVVEPALTYLYIPWVNQQSLLQFDATDFVSGQNRLAYQLTNRLIARWREAGGEVRSHEVATLGILQSWNLQPQTRQFSDNYLTGLTPERVDQAVNVLASLNNGFSLAQERTLSNLVFNGSLSPVPGTAFQGTLAFNTEENRTDGINAGIQLRRPDLLTLEAGYTYVRGQQTNGLVGFLQIPVTKAILLEFLTRYNANTGTLLEQDAGVRYTSCCWEASIKYIYRQQGPNGTPENSVLFTFDLRVPTAATR
jgi:lipopolysaccharide assembly outer membrane protein LptD (OstA)